MWTTHVPGRKGRTSVDGATKLHLCVISLEDYTTPLYEMCLVSNLMARTLSFLVLDADA